MKNKRYHQGDEIKLTGNVGEEFGFLEAVILEGHKKGQKIWVKSDKAEAKRVQEEKVQWKEQQAGFRRLRELQAKV